MNPTPRPVFFFADTVVGQFSSGTYPEKDGDVGYEPFRGPGHFQMQTALKETGSAKCYFKLGEQKVLFCVIECPKYGIMRIRELASQN